MIHKLFPCNCWIFYQRLSVLKQPCWPTPSSQPRWPSQPRSPPPPSQTPFSHFWRQANFAICPNLRPTMSAHARTASRKKNVKCEMPFLARHFLLSRAMFLTICGHGCQAFYAKTGSTTGGLGGSASYALSR